MTAMVLEKDQLRPLSLREAERDHRALRQRRRHPVTVTEPVEGAGFGGSVFGVGARCWGEQQSPQPTGPAGALGSYFAG